MLQSQRSGVPFWQKRRANTGTLPRLHARTARLDGHRRREDSLAFARLLVFLSFWASLADPRIMSRLGTPFIRLLPVSWMGLWL